MDELAEALEIDPENIIPYGHDKAKIATGHLTAIKSKPNGKLILVTAINPTPAGEGKTTTSVGLTDAMNRIGERTLLCLREPSLGPCFGMKGGATGGGQAQVVPMEDITPMETGFDITVASEIMAILCLAKDAHDLQARLERMVIGYRRGRVPVTAKDMNAVGAMMVLLKDAMLPNLVQTLEGNPALIHGGPFANIAHGCSSVIATQAALKMADFVVTEAGFGADLGAEKFFNIKCRQAGLAPSAAVLVATVRALKMHGGIAKEDAGTVSYDSLEKGLANLGRHIENMKQFNVPVVVAINRFTSDTSGEIAAIEAYCAQQDVPVSVCTHWAEGGHGAEHLAHTVANLARNAPADFEPLYPAEMPLFDKIETVARRIYRASHVETTPSVRNQLERWEKAGFGHFPVCMAKTPYSFSSDAKLIGAPEDHVLKLRDVRLSAGAGFVVGICGDIVTMPGLPRQPAAENMHLNTLGQIEGLS